VTYVIAQPCVDVKNGACVEDRGLQLIARVAGEVNQLRSLEVRSLEGKLLEKRRDSPLAILDCCPQSGCLSR
jgi:hypothetical protein